MGGGGLFGGGSGGATFNVPQPPKPEPIDYEAMYGAARKYGKLMLGDQTEAALALYPQMVERQFGTADEMARRLDNDYFRQARGIISDEMQAAGGPSAIEAELQRRAVSDLEAGPTAADRQIQAAGLGAMGVQADQVRARQIAADQVGQGTLGQSLMQQAIERSQSGGRLSADAERDAVQSARGAMAARGLGAGSGSMAAEMLNRDRFARARQAEDVAFAQGVQGQDLTRQFQNVQSRLAASQSNQDASLRAGMTNQAANMNQLAANRAFMIGARDSVLSAEDARRSQALGASQLDLARRQRRIGLAGAYGDMDPYRQGLNAAFQLGGANLDRSINMASGAFNNSLQTAGNVETFNRNMQASQYNSWMNNNAAVQAANAQAGAMGQSGMMGMMGGIGGGLLTGAGLAL